jgi:hypothetical protein
MNLSSNYEEVMEFLMKVRKQSRLRGRKSYTVDFRPINEITPAATLALAAELDRWRTIENTTLVPWKSDEWNPNVKCLLAQMGIFDLLKTKVNIHHAMENDKTYFKVTTGCGSDGEKAGKVAKELCTATDNQLNLRAMYTALSEAMTNVAQHAYPENGPNRPHVIHNKWWLASSYDPLESKITIMIYDQGVGIPYTLPRSGFYEQIKFYMKQLSGASNDCEMIEAALKSGRSQTLASHRGKGLKQILQFSEEDESGLLRIISAKGEVSIQANKKTERKLHETNLEGTFIQWEFSVQRGKKNEKQTN